VAILDAGAQYGKVIDRRVRELRVRAELVPMSTPASQLVKAGFSGIIISGGPESVYGPKAPKFDSEIFSCGIPVLGICYGMQLLNYHLGGVVSKKETREDGVFHVEIVTKSILFDGISSPSRVLLTHGDSVIEIAPDLEVVALSPEGIPSALQHKTKPLYGVQFHPEVDLSVDGKALLSNFLFKVCNLKPNFDFGSRKQAAIDYIRGVVGDASVLILVSGGVDSSVCAALLYEALGKDRCYAIHIDNGFMRLDESRKVADALKSIGLELKVVHAQERFYNAKTEIDGVETPMLKTVLAPEVKRKIIGDTFIRVSEEEIRGLGIDPASIFLAQGTLRPDLIESASHIASSKAEVIKTHHNDTALVRALRKAGRVVEPLQDYHKDEVRELGKDLGLPEALVWRQPFPGPGLAIRIICSESPYYHEQQDSISNKLRSLWTRTFKAHLLPIRTVGVQGDGRSYSSLVGLFGPSNWKDLMETAKKIPKLIHEVNRVVYVIGSTGEEEKIAYEITPTRLEPDVIHQLQAADDIVNTELFKHGLLRKLSQVPVVLFPANFGKAGARSIAIRAFITNDFMTGVPGIPGEHFPLSFLDDVASEILSRVPGIVRVVYDLTTKPPATTEWE